MKSSKLIDIFKEGNIVVPLYLLKNYKKFDIKMDEFVFLMYLYNLGNKFLFDPNKFSSELNIDLKDVLNYISILTDKKLIKVEVEKNDKNVMEEVIVLDDLYQKITYFTIEEVNNETKDSNIYELIEKEFGRSLGEMEYEIINAWLENNYSEELIKEALKEAVYNGVYNLRYIDKILYEWGKKNITTVEQVEEARKKRNKKDDSEVLIDTEIFDCNWLDDDE